MKVSFKRRPDLNEYVWEVMKTENECQKLAACKDGVPWSQASEASWTHASHATRPQASDVERMDALTSGNRLLPEGTSAKCQQHATGKPLVDPPEFADRIRDTDKEPHWIPGAFPTIFQNETGDPFNFVLRSLTW